MGHPLLPDYYLITTLITTLITDYYPEVWPTPARAESWDTEGLARAWEQVLEKELPGMIEAAKAEQVGAASRRMCRCRYAAAAGQLLASCWAAAGQLLGGCWAAAGQLLGCCCWCRAFGAPLVCGGSAPRLPLLPPPSMTLLLLQMLLLLLQMLLPLPSMLLLLLLLQMLLLLLHMLLLLLQMLGCHCAGCCSCEMCPGSWPPACLAAYQPAACLPAR